MLRVFNNLDLISNCRLHNTQHFLEELVPILSQFKHLEVLEVTYDAIMARLPPAYQSDFELVELWANACPSLRLCIPTSTNAISK